MPRAQATAEIHLQKWCLVSGTPIPAMQCLLMSGQKYNPCIQQKILKYPFGEKALDSFSLTLFLFPPSCFHKVSKWLYSFPWETEAERKGRFLLPLPFTRCQHCCSCTQSFAVLLQFFIFKTTQCHDSSIITTVSLGIHKHVPC